MKIKYVVVAPATPGATPTNIKFCETLPEARRVAKTFRQRPDLRWQDVRIDSYPSGILKEYAGPHR